jgi:hypothetical protein
VAIRHPIYSRVLTHSREPCHLILFVGGINSLLSTMGTELRNLCFTLLVR